MASSELLLMFAEMTACLDTEFEQRQAAERDVAWQVEARPMPDGLVSVGAPLGHIAFMGDFVQHKQT